jgi:TP53 regulating kinase-like protein
MSQCAESNVYACDFYGRAAVMKERPVKAYRHPTLDQKIREQRTGREARALAKCKRIGVPAPDVYAVDREKCVIIMERLNGVTVRDFINACPMPPGIAEATAAAANAVPASAVTEDDEDRVATMKASATWAALAAIGPVSAAAGRILEMVGEVVGKLHEADKIHGDLTTSNFIIGAGSMAPDALLAAAAQDSVPADALVSVIDFGLVRESTGAEERAVDLYVLERAVQSTHPLLPFDAMTSVEAGYRAAVNKPKAETTLVRLKAVRARGRKRSMIG